MLPSEALDAVAETYGCLLVQMDDLKAVTGTQKPTCGLLGDVAYRKEPDTHWLPTYVVASHNL